MSIADAGDGPTGAVYPTPPPTAPFPAAGEPPAAAGPGARDALPDYRWYVYATDAAGHTAKAPAWNTLTVK